MELIKENGIESKMEMLMRYMKQSGEKLECEKSEFIEKINGKKKEIENQIISEFQEILGKERAGKEMRKLVERMTDKDKRDIIEYYGYCKSYKIEELLIEIIGKPKRENEELERRIEELERRMEKERKEMKKKIEKETIEEMKKSFDANTREMNKMMKEIRDTLKNC